ncbi:hypothetical protein LCGC14_2851290 [marine sediment metagenome]|uniref:Uncharacterized protein n=1 Tax=marine sediment metagenome TaxID=412755 RepID=A0A0F9AZ76_9ZZZZ
MADPRRFYLNRIDDVSGISGTGRIADGVQFEDGICVLRWRSEVATTVIYDKLEHLLILHGHDGKTKLEWID